MVDCGSAQGFSPIDKIIELRLLPDNILGNLTLTNYDQDHFSEYPYLKKRIRIRSFCFPRNLTSDDIRDSKEDITEPIKKICDTLDNLEPLTWKYTPPYEKFCFHLEKTDFSQGWSTFPQDWSTNDLSQVVFVSYKGTTVCISGDLTSRAWDKLFPKDRRFCYLLGDTNIFIASHHGREDGYNERIFEYCKPECIILSDDKIQYETQKGMASKYADKVASEGVPFNGKIRKVLTTRTDGHILIDLEENTRKYSPLFI
jgi:beta-lactamase superfamily II metal-dependent hydrolase